MQRDPESTCATCAWWHCPEPLREGSVLGRGDIGIDVDDGRVGKCQARPPVAREDDEDGCWPDTFAFEGCAEHPANVKIRVQAEERWRMEARNDG